MGLDMRLMARKYISCYDNEQKEQCELIKKIIGIDGTEDTMGITVQFDVCYWRKAYSIIDYIESRLDGDFNNGEERYISDGILKDLKDICKRIMEGDEEAKEEIPYDNLYGDEEYYMQDIELTYKMLDKLDLDKYDYYFEADW